MKLFRTGNIEVVQNCQACFEFSSSSVLWAERMKKFEARYLACDRTFIHYGHCMDFSSIECVRCNLCSLIVSFFPFFAIVLYDE